MKTKFGQDLQRKGEMHDYLEISIEEFTSGFDAEKKSILCNC